MAFGINPLANRQTGVLPLSQVASVSGLEFFQKMMTGEFPPPPITALIPLVFTDVSEGRIFLRSQADESFYNPIGSVHGGYSATLLDTVMACAIHSTLKAGEGYTSLEFKIIFHRPILKDTGEVRGEGKVLSRGGRVGTAEGFLRDTKDRLLVSGTTTCLIFDVPKAP